MSNTVTKRKSKRIFYFDALRALAIICVVIIHTFALTRHFILSGYIIPTFNWVLTEFMLNPMRLGVDLFLMLSGALSLGRVWDIKTFLGKRIPRIVAPFLFWNIVMITLFVLISKFTSIHFIDTVDISSVTQYAIDVFNANTLGFRPNWFFWMILGTYFIMPIFNKWLLHSELKEAEYFLVFWLITCLFDFTLFIDFPVKLIYFTSPIGLVVLGYYLRHTERKLLNNPYFALFGILLIVVVIMILAYSFSTPKKMYIFNRYSILLSLEVACVFLLFKNFKKFNIGNPIKKVTDLFRKLASALAKYSYGMYLVHYPLIYLFYKLLPVKTMQYDVLSFSLVLIGLLGSLILLSILNRVPVLNQIIGAK